MFYRHSESLFLSHGFDSANAESVLTLSGVRELLLCNTLAFVYMFYRHSESLFLSHGFDSANAESALNLSCVQIVKNKKIPDTIRTGDSFIQSNDCINTSKLRYQW